MKKYIIACTVTLLISSILISCGTKETQEKSANSNEAYSHEDKFVPLNKTEDSNNDSSQSTEQASNSSTLISSSATYSVYFNSSNAASISSSIMQGSTAEIGSSTENSNGSTTINLPVDSGYDDIDISKIAWIETENTDWYYTQYEYIIYAIENYYNNNVPTKFKCDIGNATQLDDSNNIYSLDITGDNGTILNITINNIKHTAIIINK